MNKKLLLATFSLMSGICLQAQNLQSDNFDALTIGNIGASLDGTTAGQGGWYTYAANQGAVNNFQVVAETGRGNVLSVQGVNVASGTTEATNNARFIWKGEVNWSSRTAGNNVAKLEFDLFTGATTTSKNIFTISILNVGGKNVVGFQYTPETKALIGLTTSLVSGSTTQTQTTGIGLATVNGSPAAATLPANTWVKLICFVNYTTGQTTYQVPSISFNGSSNPNSLYMGASATTYAPTEVNFIAIAGTANASSATVKFDNYSLTATNNETASVKNNILEEFKIYPNPTTGILNFAKDDQIEINSIQFIDLNGRIVKAITPEKFSDLQIDISDLTSGMYLMNINTNDGVATKKIIKK